MTEQRSAEIRGIVQDVLADADTRTSLQSSGAMAGYNNGFFLASPDGNFSLKVGGQVQIRWTMNSAKEQNTDWGFENRRTKLDFSGQRLQQGLDLPGPSRVQPGCPNPVVPPMVLQPSTSPTSRRPWTTA